MLRPWQQKTERRPWQQDNTIKSEKYRKDEHKAYNTRAWMNFRAYYWAHHPRLCVVCGRFANILDHIKPLSEGGAMLDEANVQGLCYRHHNAKHNREKANNKKQ